MDWAFLRRRYERQGASLRQLERESGVNRGTLSVVSKREGWVRLAHPKLPQRPANRHLSADERFLRRIEALVDGYLGRIEQRFNLGADQPDADTRDLATLARIVDKLSDLSAHRRPRPAAPGAEGAQANARNADDRREDDWSDWDSPAFFERFARHLEEAVGQLGLDETAGEPAAESPPALDA